jgi:DNA-binding NarL/FixJ family response regulator
MARASSQKASVVLVDDHAIVREGLAQLINAAADLAVVGQAASADEAMEIISKMRPRLAIVDLSLGGKPGIELIKDLAIQFPETIVLVLSMHDEELYAQRTIRAGAKGYIMKQEASGQILNAARRVLSGGIYLSEKMSLGLLQQLAGARKPGRMGLELLSDRELQIFEMIGRGTSTRDIAERLHLSVKTVDAHREHIKQKLNLTSSTELVRHAVQYSLEQS